MHAWQNGQKIAERCSPMFMDPSAMDRAAVMNMGCTVVNLGLTTIRLLPEQVVCDQEVLPKIMDCVLQARQVDFAVVRNSPENGLIDFAILVGFLRFCLHRKK